MFVYVVYAHVYVLRKIPFTFLVYFYIGNLKTLKNEINAFQQNQKSVKKKNAGKSKRLIALAQSPTF